MRKNGKMRCNSLVNDDSKSCFKAERQESQSNIGYIDKNTEYEELESEFKALKSENLGLHHKIACIKKDFEIQIVKIKKQIESEKQTEIDSLTKYYIEKINECEENFSEELVKRLEMEKEKLKKVLELEAYSKIQQVLEAKQQEFDFLQEQFMHRLKIKDSVNQYAGKQKSSNHRLEDPEDIENRFKIALEAKSSEYERKLHAQIQENYSLRKEISQLSQKILESQSKLEAATLTCSDKDSENAYIATLNRKYNELLQSYHSIKSKQEKTIKPTTHTYCSKCKAFLNSNSELTEKISRLREFLSN